MLTKFLCCGGRCICCGAKCITDGKSSAMDDTFCTCCDGEDSGVVVQMEGRHSVSGAESGRDPNISPGEPTAKLLAVRFEIAFRLFYGVAWTTYLLANAFAVLSFDVDGSA